MNVQRIVCAASLVLLPTLSVAKEPAKPVAKSEKAGAPPKADEKQAAMMAAMEKFATPGAEHKWLAKAMVGTWESNVTMFGGPAPQKAPPGKATIKAVLGERFVMEEHEGQMMGKPFAGLGITGYDNAKKKFVSTWTDTMGTGIMSGEGTLDAAGKVMTSSMTETNPVNGEPHTVKVVDTWEGDKKHVALFFDKGPDGKDAKMMEIVYTRK